MWRVYKHTGTDKDYDAYKEALNAATNEVTKSKRNFEHKLAQNIKSDSKSFYAYVRSKQNVRDKVGPLEDNAGNIITHGFLMVEEDRKCTTILVLLDLSCAFDTINHELLLRRLEHSVGISGAALEWLHSYVSERYHQVAVSSARSSHCHLERGMAQGRSSALFCTAFIHDQLATS